MESYKQEIIRKRRAARVFWLLVLLFAIFLFYFFQGYYPNIKGGLQYFFSGSGNTHTTDDPDLVRAFGIINIRTTPRDTYIALGQSGSIGYDEKKMVDYGSYMMRLIHDGYLEASMDFSIDKEKPFFIENITLLPLARYAALSGVTSAYQVGTDSIIYERNGRLSTSSGQTSTGWVSSGSLSYIGGPYFRDGSSVVQWTGQMFKRVSRDIEEFVETCSSVSYSDGLFRCRATQSVLTDAGAYATGVIDMRHGIGTRSGSMIDTRDGEIRIYRDLTGSVDLDHTTIMDHTIYTLSGGILRSVGVDSEFALDIDLDRLVRVVVIGDHINIVGYKGEDPYLIVRYIHDPLPRLTRIPLPKKLDYKSVQLRDVSGNLLISTPDAILFTYRRSDTIHWLVDGQILTIKPSGSIYKKDNNIWMADWSPLIEK